MSDAKLPIEFIMLEARLCAQLLSCVRLFYNPMDCTPPPPPRLLCPWDFPARILWSRLPFPNPGDLPNPGIEPASLMSPALAGRFFTTEPPGIPM